MEEPDVNTRKEWSRMDLSDLRHSIEAQGLTVGEIACFLMRTETEMREKAAERGRTLPQ